MICQTLGGVITGGLIRGSLGHGRAMSLVHSLSLKETE